MHDLGLLDEVLAGLDGVAPEGVVVGQDGDHVALAVQRDDMAQRYVGMMASVKEAGDTLQSTLRSLEKLRQDVAALKPRAGRR